MLAMIPSRTLREWEAFLMVEHEDELEAQARAKAQSGVETRGHPRPRQGFGIERK